MTADGDTVAAVSSSRKLSPASNQKLFTTGVAMKMLGPGYRFETKLATDGRIEDGTLKGDLYIIGGGDPTIGSTQKGMPSLSDVFGEWKKILTDSGIKRIEGRVIGDPRWFDGEDYHDDWPPEDTGFDYGAAVSGLNFHENIHTLSLEPGSKEGDPVRLEQVYPTLPWMKYSVSAKTVSSKGSDRTWLLNTPLMPVGNLCGTFPLGYKTKTNFSNCFPAFTCAQYFCNYLDDNRIKVTGGPADVDPFGCVREDPSVAGARPAPDSLTTVLGSYCSPTLKEIATVANFHSNNFYTEAIFRALSKKICGSASIPASRRTLKDLLYTITSRRDAKIADGCGLSRKNFLTPEFMVRFLRRMAREKVFCDYLETIPTPGNGTIIARFAKREPEFKERIHMKSGSMGGIRCYSGYILPSDGNPGKMIVFSVMTGGNTTGPIGANAALEKIIGALAEEN